MSEANLSRRLVKKLAPHLDFWHRVENSVADGTPDVFYVSSTGMGAVELKHIVHYPKRPATALRFKRFTIDQVNCIEAFGAEGNGKSWILVQVELDHYLFNWTMARSLQAGRPREWWETNCLIKFKRTVNYLQLANIL